MASNERLDTMEGYNDLYDDEEDQDGEAQFRYGASDDEEDDNDGEIRDFDNNEEGKEDEGKKKESKNKFKHDKIEVNFDDIVDDDDQECLLDYQQSNPPKNEALQKMERKQKAEDDSSLVKGDDIDAEKNKDFDNLSAWSDNTAQQNLFKIKESMDKGLADMETGSEVYMSELLVSIKQTNQILIIHLNTLFNFFLLFYRLASTWKTSMRQTTKMRKIYSYWVMTLPKLTIFNSTS